MPTSHFSYWRETWLNSPTVSICDVKSAENMSLSGLILAGFYEIAEDSQSSARIPSTRQACAERSGVAGADSRLCLPGQEWKIPGWGWGRGRKRTVAKIKGHLCNVQRCQLSTNHARSIPAPPASQRAFSPPQTPVPIRARAWRSRPRPAANLSVSSLPPIAPPSPAT